MLMVLRSLGLWLRQCGDHWWWCILDNLHGDGSSGGQDFHRGSWDIVGWRHALLEDKGEDLAGRTVDSQLAAVDARAHIVLRVAVVAGPADTDLTAGALQRVVQAGLAQSQQAQEAQCEYWQDQKRRSILWVSSAYCRDLFTSYLSSLGCVRLVIRNASGELWYCSFNGPLTIIYTTSHLAIRNQKSVISDLRVMLRDRHTQTAPQKFQKKIHS